MSQNTLGTGVLVLKANATQLETGLDKAAAKTKDFNKKTNSAGAGFGKMFAIAAVAAAAVKGIQSAAKAVEELAQKQREVLAVVTDLNSKQEAQRLGLLGSDEDIERLKEADKTIKGIEQTWEEAKADILSIPLNRFDKFLQENFGVETRKIDKAAQDEFLKSQREAKAEQEALTKSVKDFDAELTKAAATIGMTAGEIKLWELAQKGIITNKFSARLLANDVKAFEFELKKANDTMGMTAEQIKRMEIATRGASAEMLKSADSLIAQKQALDRVNESMSLVVKNPVEEFSDKMSRLQELYDRGRIGWDAYARSVAKVGDEFIAFNKAEEMHASVPALKQGTRETMEFLINARSQQQRADPAALLRGAIDKQTRIQEQIRNNGALLIEAIKDKPVIKVEEVNW